MTGAGAIIRSAVAFNPPDDMMINPKTAKYFSFGSWMILRVRPTIQGRSAHGKSKADVREIYGNTYGES